jgi:site-specific recombinase XerD
VGRPKEGWVFPADTQSGHITESSIRKQHYKAIEEAQLDHFEIYCFRHTFLTILGNSGCDPYTLCRIAGHGDIQMGMHYCRTQKEFIETAFDRLVGFSPEPPKGGYFRGLLAKF